ncbi:hypothetical protein G4B88_009564 [Cannabis sativa]|uniref:Uncharacterized protein n=1 Tax=Cannabis sativa TaxID=3483 RepID=A0A7J6DLG9_CANSA|nr:hypothetical protein G4B88_009564 [Cannabis sativa]
MGLFMRSLSTLFVLLLLLLATGRATAPMFAELRAFPAATAVAFAAVVFALNIAKMAFLAAAAVAFADVVFALKIAKILIK